MKKIGSLIMIVLVLLLFFIGTLNVIDNLTIKRYELTETKNVITESFVFSNYTLEMYGAYAIPDISNDYLENNIRLKKVFNDLKDYDTNNNDNLLIDNINFINFTYPAGEQYPFNVGYEIDEMNIHEYKRIIEFDYFDASDEFQTPNAKLEFMLLNTYEIRPDTYLNESIIVIGYFNEYMPINENTNFYFLSTSNIYFESEINSFNISYNTYTTEHIDLTTTTDKIFNLMLYLIPLLFIGGTIISLYALLGKKG